MNNIEDTRYVEISVENWSLQVSIVVVFSCEYICCCQTTAYSKKNVMQTKMSGKVIVITDACKIK